MEETSKVKKVLFIGALLLTTIVMMGDSLITPAAGTLYAEFDNEIGVNALLSTPTFVAMIASIVFGALSMKIDKKTLLIVGMVCFIVSGVFGVAIDSLPYMIFMRVVLGIAMGATNVCAIAIISQVFIDDTERSRYISFVTAGTSLCGIFLTLISGALAEAFGWRVVFHIHWVGVIILALIILFVPKCPPVKADEGEETSEGLIVNPENEKTWLRHCIGLICSQFVWYALYGIVFFQIAVYIGEQGIGNEAFSGSMISLVSTFAFIFCLLFSLVYRRIREWSPVVFYGLFAVGFVILMLGSSRLTTIIACIIIGIGTGTGLSYFPFRGTIIVPKEKMSIAVTAYSACMGIGMSVSTYVATLIKAILGTDTFASMLPVLIVIALIGTAVGVVLAIREKSHPRKYYLEQPADEAAAAKTTEA